MVSDFKYKLSAVAIMKYEEDYVLEWVAYHHCIGVEHFYIYDNNPESSMQAVLQKYIDAGIVDLIPAYGDVQMFKCYNNAIQSFKDDSEYIAFIDADEFIMPIQDTNLAELVDSILTRFNKFGGSVGGLAVKWAVYGSGGHVHRPDGPVIENYLYKENGELDRHVKTIVNPRCVSAWINPHFPMYRNGCYSINEKGMRVFGPFMDGDERSLIRVNHYYYKSEDEFMKRVRKGKCDIRITESQMQDLINSKLDDLQSSNNEYDPIMLRYADRVKAEMQKFRSI